MKKVLLLLIVCFCSFVEQLSSQSLNFEATGTIPDFIAEDINGVEHELYADYLNNDQIVVLEFLNVFCGTCIAYAPQVEEFYQTYGPDGTNEVSLIGLDISAGSDNEDCVNYSTPNIYPNNTGATYPIINGNAASWYSADVSGTPTFYILFPDGSYTNICSSTSCQNSSSSSNIANDLESIVNQWISSNMGLNPWGDAPDTDCNATILIPSTTNITLDDTSIDDNTWIGVFYEDSNGDMTFGGGIEWNGETTSIAAWGSEAGMNNGFLSGEVFTFGMINPSSGETIFSTDATYTFGDSFYGCNGLSGISNLAFESESNTTDCNDNDELMSPFGCAIAISAFTCAGEWNGMTIADACPESCDACGGDSGPVLGCTNSDADNYNPSATEDDGSCIISGCMCDIAFNYNAAANNDNGTCVIMSGGCSDPSALNYSGDACAGAAFVAEDCQFPLQDVDWDNEPDTDCNATILIPADADIIINGESPSVGDLIGVFIPTPMVVYH